MFYKKHFTKKNFGIMLLLWAMLVPFLSLSQINVDSLKRAISKAKTDTAKISALNNIALALATPDSISSALNYSKQAISLSRSIHSDKKLAESMLNAAIIYWTAGQTDSAMVYTKQPVAYYEKDGVSKMLVKAYRTAGGIYRDKLQYKEANEYLLKALGMAQKLSDSTDIGSINLSLGKLCQANSEFNLAINYFKAAMDIDVALKLYKPAINAANYLASVYTKQGISAMGAKIYFEALEINSKSLKDANITAIINVNLGNLYSEKGDTANAMKYYQASYSIFKNMDNKKLMAQLLGDIGNVYMNEGNYKKAEAYELESMQEILAVGDKENITLCYTNVAEFYNHTKDYDKALKYYNMAIPLQEEMGDKEGLAYTFSGLADLCINKGDLTKAEEYGIKAYDIANEIHLERQVRDEAKVLSGLYDNLHKPDKAFFYYKKFIEARDTLENKAEAKKLIQAELNHEYEQKQIAEQVEDAKRQAIEEEKRQHERVIRNIILSAFVVVLFLMGLLFRNLLRIRKSKQIITEQKLEVENQKLIVEEKNKDITDSIKYASRIQRALLTSHEYIGKQVKENFILFKPRDIVSGDFYWAFKSQSGAFYLACCDCTGHGVPGAFMSLLNISMLNETVIERRILSPEQVLNEIRNNIIKALNPEKADTESKDGMDCSLCAIDFSKKQMYLACANNPVWIVRAGAIIEIAPDKMPVGIQYGDQKSFTLHTVQLNAGDSIYMFTDGYADQFGGPKGKKFKYKALQELILANVNRPMSEQKNILDRTFSEWMGKLEQVDDMLIIGLKV